MIRAVKLSKRAQKQLKDLPRYIVDKLETWVQAVEIDGLQIVRKISGYHDEPLRGNRVGQRSIRLNRAYRAIYEIQSDGTIEFVFIEEVNKHDY